MAYLWTLTYKVARTKRADVVRDLRRFYEELQRIYGRMPLLAVIERGRRGTRRLHVHFATDRWLSHGLVEQVWHRGFVWVGDPGKLAGDPGVDRLSKYLSKYVAKQYEGEHAGDQDRGKREHRYHVSQGWNPPAWRRRFHNVGEAFAWLMRTYGSPDLSVTFGDPRTDPIHGHWMHFPDESLWEPPNPGP